jgi:hypothetical protein
MLFAVCCFSAVSIPVQTAVSSRYVTCMHLTSGFYVCFFPLYFHSFFVSLFLLYLVFSLLSSSYLCHSLCNCFFI